MVCSHSFYLQLHPLAVNGRNKSAVGHAKKKLLFERLDYRRIIRLFEIVVMRYQHLASYFGGKVCYLSYFYRRLPPLQYCNIRPQSLADINLLYGRVVSPNQYFSSVWRGKKIVAVFHRSNSLQGCHSRVRAASSFAMRMPLYLFFSLLSL
jgi:hypothetical protein